MNLRLFALVAVASCTLAIACRQDMHDQPRLEPFEGSRFFADGRAARPLPEGVVARGQLHEDPRVVRGVDGDGKPLERSPLEPTSALLERGRERFDIYCSPCHARTGDGDGMIVQRGYPRPASFHEQRMHDATDGYVFAAISDGFGVMPSYSAQVPPRDRWAIVAYIRALQLSRRAPLAALGDDERERLDQGSVDVAEVGDRGHGGHE